MGCQEELNVILKNYVDKKEVAWEVKKRDF